MNAFLLMRQLLEEFQQVVKSRAAPAEWPAHEFRKQLQKLQPPRRVELVEHLKTALCLRTDKEVAELVFKLHPSSLSNWKSGLSNFGLVPQEALTRVLTQVHRKCNPPKFLSKEVELKLLAKSSHPNKND